MKCEIITADCESFLRQYNSDNFALTFLDPPFNQKKEYNSHNDNMPHSDYWDWMKRVCKLRIDPPLLETEKYRRPNGMFVTDVWDDIRELTSGYFAGEEPLRSESGV